MDSLNALEQNMHELLDRYRAQQQTIAALREENTRQREEIIRTHAELVQLQTDYKHLQTAHALVADHLDEEERRRARQRITNLIAQVDRAMEVLKQ